MNSAPLLINGWYHNSFAEAMGDLYYSTFNTLQTPVLVATWTGSVPAAGRYQLEVYIPRQQTPGAAPRTNRAVYQISPQGTGIGSFGVANQQVSASQWVPLGSSTSRGQERSDARGGWC